MLPGLWELQLLSDPAIPEDLFGPQISVAWDFPDST